MNSKAYHAAKTGAVYLERSQAGCIQVSGADRLAVIHRLSTNAVTDLQSNTGAVTVFTNHNGRIIDVVSILAIDAETCWLITSQGRGAQIASYLKKNLFFNDRFSVTDLSDTISQLHIYGPQATAILEQACGLALQDVALWHHIAADIDGCPIRLQRIRPIHGEGWRIVADLAAIEAVGEVLDEAGAAFLDPATFEVLRVEHGQPDLPELNLEYIPLEANLWDAVSFKKGCYVGQEIIARMESRGRLAKKLGGVHLSEAIMPPSTLTTEAGKDAGIVTSVVYSPTEEAWLGLAYLRPNAEDATLNAGRAVVTAHPLPFASDTEQPA